jgi:hypothetical protein
MKLVSATSILLISSSGLARATLPPGFDTYMHCPPGSCSLYIEHPQLFGRKSAFYKCYAEKTNEVTEAVWTGSKTHIEVPEGWIQDPEECNSPTPSPTRNPRNIDTPGGLCVYDSDCYTTIRGAEPLNATGPELCDCYAASKLFTFDETEGQEHFRRARCRGDVCDGFEAYCPLAADDNGMAECALRPIKHTTPKTSSDDKPRSKTPGPSSSSSTEIVSPTPAPFTRRKNIDTPGGLCTTDSDCQTKIRSAGPENPTGPDLCDCYAASSQLPFMECEDQPVCIMAMCQNDKCAGFEAYCPLAPGDNGMAECALRPIGGDSKETPTLVVM